MNIILTGSSGYIGIHFLKYLIKKKIKIISIYQKKKPKIKSSKINYLKFDIFDNKKLLIKNRQVYLFILFGEKKLLKSKNLNEAKKQFKF